MASTALVPLTLLAAGVGNAAAVAAAPAADNTPVAAFVLDPATGSYTSGGANHAAAAAQEVRAAATFKGKAATLQILTKTGSGSALADLSLASQSDTKARAGWAAGPRFVDLSWPDLGATAYQVYRDGKLIGTTAGHSLRDTGVTPGTTVDYQITGATKDLGHTWGFTATVPTSSDPATLKATAAQVEAAATKYTKTAVVYRTFIRQKSGKVPSWAKRVSGCKYASGYAYKGDNRGFSSKIDGPSYRTKLTGIVYWTKSPYDLYRTTGKTHVIKLSTGKVVDTRQASAKSMDFQTKTRFDGKTRAVHGKIEARNPFCDRGSISGYYDARLARNGDFYVSGKHKNVPDHEMYIYGYRSNGTHTTKAVHQAKLGSFACLFNGACENVTIADNGGY
jgi:hypothetical protein